MKALTHTHTVRLLQAVRRRTQLLKQYHVVREAFRGGAAARVAAAAECMERAVVQAAAALTARAPARPVTPPPAQPAGAGAGAGAGVGVGAGAGAGPGDSSSTGVADVLAWEEGSFSDTQRNLDVTEQLMTLLGRHGASLTASGGHGSSATATLQPVAVCEHSQPHLLHSQLALRQYIARTMLPALSRRSQQIVKMAHSGSGWGGAEVREAVRQFLASWRAVHSVLVKGGSSLVSFARAPPQRG